MYDRCESCGKSIEDSDDVKLFSNDGETIRTFCKNCYETKPRSNNI